MNLLTASGVPGASIESLAAGLWFAAAVCGTLVIGALALFLAEIFEAHSSGRGRDHAHTH